MPSRPSTFERYFAVQGLDSYPERLRLLLSQQTYSQLSKKTGIKAESLSHYKTGKILPNLARLAAIAYECDVSLQWLLFGDVDAAKAPTGLTPVNETRTIKQFTVNDDAMYPTIAPMGGVLYKSLASSFANKIATEGIYLISLQGHKVVRRLQWQHNDECYLVFGDNPKYRPQSIKSPHIIGKAVSIVTPI